MTAQIIIVKFFFRTFLKIFYCIKTLCNSIMDIQSKLRELAEKVNTLKDRIETEESTKHAFILPFINILGYDAFNPIEVVPEFTADLGLKKGEKVDYAIFQDDKPILIIECKNWKENLHVHNSQLFRYFHATQTRFALLTNGRVPLLYRLGGAQ